MTKEQQEKLASDFWAQFMKDMAEERARAEAEKATD